MTSKTTVDIREPLLDEAKKVAAETGTSLRSLIEEGLELAIGKRRNRRPFSLRKASFRGKGVREGVDQGDWNRIRSMIYEGRGE